MVDMLVVFVRDDDDADNAERQLRRRGYPVMVVLHVVPLLAMFQMVDVRIAYRSRLLRLGAAGLQQRYGWADVPLVVVIPSSQRTVLTQHQIFLMRLL
jgi:hypothetical protein